MYTENLVILVKNDYYWTIFDVKGVIFDQNGWERKSILAENDIFDAV